MATGGDAVARDAAGKVVFVRGALPGETVLARVVEERRDFARAVVERVVDASTDRVQPPCEAVGRGCGGCGWQHVAPDAQRRHKEQIVVDALRRLGHVDAVPLRPTVTLPTAGFRTTIRVVGGTAGVAGFRRGGTHEVVVPVSCLVAHPLVEAERARGGLPRGTEVQLRAGVATGEVGHGVVHERVAGRTWRISPGSFFQTRPDGAEALATLVRDAAGPPTGTAADLYAGVGLFAGVLADDGWHVVAVETNEAAVADARHNLADAPVEIVHAEVAAWDARPVDVVVADPGRPGLARPGVGVVAACDPRRLVLVSCDAASLGRDAGLLAAAGFVLRSATLVDLFPHTPHVEVVSVFDRHDPPAGSQ